MAVLALGTRGHFFFPRIFSPGGVTWSCKSPGSSWCDGPWHVQLRDVPASFGGAICPLLCSCSDLITL